MRGDFMKLALRLLWVAGAFWLVSCAEPETTAAPQAEGQTEPADAPAISFEGSSAILAAIAHPDRPEADKARDAGRRPDLVLSFY
ncbi:MAG: hypothetical protein V3U43_08905, partial [Pseudomonadales bacterium]